MSTNTVPRVFLSYAREDFVAAKQLCVDLEANSISVWLDAKDLDPGMHWRDAISTQIRTCRFFIALLSDNSVSKHGFVQQELRIALEVLNEFPENEIYVLPVRLNKCVPVQPRLSDLNWVDLFPSYGAGLEKLVGFLQKRLQFPEAHVDLPQEAARRSVSLSSLEGFWIDKYSPTRLYAKAVNGRLFAPYVWGNSSELTASFYDLELISDESGDKLVGRFEWLLKPISGYVLLSVRSVDLMVGGWWYEEHIGFRIDQDLSSLDDSFPNMHPVELRRSRIATDIPSWAEFYFGIIQQLGYTSATKRILLGQISDD